jgi:hypothetical protein
MGDASLLLSSSLVMQIFAKDSLSLRRPCEIVVLAWHHVASPSEVLRGNMLRIAWCGHGVLRGDTPE